MMRRRSAWPEQDVVVLAEEAHGRRASGSGRGASGRSNSSLPSSSRKVTSCGRRRSNTGLSLVRPDQFCASIDRRGPEGPQVAQDELLGDGRGVERASRPGLERGVLGLAAGAPHAARRDLHQRACDARRVADRLDVVADAARHERAPELPRA